MAIGYNEDLTTAILLRLPVKSILRLKTVSKQWFSIVSSRQFRQIHSASAPGGATATGIFFNNGNTELDYLSLDNHVPPMPNSDQPIKIISSSGGLLLLLLQSRDYCICNPTTNEIQPLADLPQVTRAWDYGSVVANLAFDPSKSVHYKVLFLFKCYDLLSVDKKHKFMIYSSETRTFRSVETIHYPSRVSGVYWNDAIHWISVCGRHVFYFDLSKECMNKSSLPAIGDVEYYGESRGNLHAVTLFSSGGTRQTSVFEVYELKRDYSAWSFKCKVDIASFQYEPSLVSISQGHCYVKVSSILDDEKEGLTIVLLVRSIFDTFVVYNVKKKKLNNVLRLRDGYFGYIGHQYKPTLAWVLE